MPKGSRKGESSKITIKQARQKFNEYYDNKHGKKQPLQVFKAKLFDMMYQKKGERLIKCNDTKTTKTITNSKGITETLKPGYCETGSLKYMSDEGPKTFDVEGVDAFEAGKEFVVTMPDGTKKGCKGKSKCTAIGHTYKEPQDKTSKVYGPRVKKQKKKNKNKTTLSTKNICGKNELYKDCFNRVLKERKKLKKGDRGYIKKSLVEKYWEDYRKEEAQGKISDKLRRKNKKTPIPKAVVITPEFLMDFSIGGDDYFSADSLEAEDIDFNIKYKLFKQEDLILIKNSDTNETLSVDSLEYGSQINYLQRLKILTSEKKPKFNNELKDVKLFKIFFEHDDDESQNVTYILDIETGELNKEETDVDEEDESDEDNLYHDNILEFWTEYGEDLIISKVTPVSETKNQIGGYIFSFNDTYSSSSDEYSVFSDDD